MFDVEIEREGGEVITLTQENRKHAPFNVHCVRHGDPDHVIAWVSRRWPDGSEYGPPSTTDRETIFYYPGTDKRLPGQDWHGPACNGKGHQWRDIRSVPADPYLTNP